MLLWTSPGTAHSSNSKPSPVYACIYCTEAVDIKGLKLALPTQFSMQQSQARPGQAPKLKAGGYGVYAVPFAELSKAQVMSQ